MESLTLNWVHFALQSPSPSSHNLQKKKKDDHERAARQQILAKSLTYRRGHCHFPIAAPLGRPEASSPMRETTWLAAAGLQSVAMPAGRRSNRHKRSRESRERLLRRNFLTLR